MERTCGQPSLFKQTSYLFLIGAQLVSALGEGIALLALLTLFGLEQDASPLEMALVILSLGVPTVVFGPISGVFADKLERKTLMVISDLMRALAMVLVVFATATWQIYLLLVLKGTFEAVFTPAKNGKLRELVADEHMDQAVGISTIIDYGCRIVGPAVGGLLVALWDTETAFWINAGGFLLSALLLLGVPRRRGALAPSEHQSEQKADLPFRQQLQEGFAFVRGVPFLKYGTLIFSLVMLVVTLADTQMVVLFREVPGGSSQLFGAIMGATGLGTLLVAGWLSQRQGKGAATLMGIGSVGVGVAFVACASFVAQHLGGTAIWFPALALVAGGFAGAIFVPFQSAAQKQVPEALTSRVFGVINALSTLATIVGPFLGGLLVAGFGAIPVFEIACGGLAVIGLLTLVFKNKIEPASTTEGKEAIDVSKSDGSASRTTAS
jgi:MFS family permease